MVLEKSLPLWTPKYYFYVCNMHGISLLLFVFVNICALHFCQFLFSALEHVLLKGQILW